MFSRLAMCSLDQKQKGSVGRAVAATVPDASSSSKLQPQALTRFLLDDLQIKGYERSEVIDGAKGESS